MNYENYKRLLQEGLENINQLHRKHESTPSMYYAVMAESTINLCKQLGINPNLKNREEMLIAATVNYPKESKLGLKYHLLKDGSKVIDTFKTEYERNQCIPILRGIGYSPVKVDWKQ